MSNQRVLVVDDDKEVVRLMRGYLEGAGYEVLVAYNGETALHTIRRERPDLVLLDINMPGKNGHEVLREMKSDENLKSIPVVILTTSDAEEDIGKTYNLGANCFITKPVNLEQFQKVVEAIEGFWLSIVKYPN